MKKRIIIDISDTGEVQLETHGYKGPQCVEDSQFIKDVLGEEVSVQLVPVYYQENGQGVKRHLPICG